MNHRLTPLALFLSLSLNAAAQTTDIETITVLSQANQVSLHADLQKQLANQGLNFSNAGGISALPVMNGLMGDRIQVLADGAPITAACGNHMNPPLSYFSGQQISNIKVLPGVSPVSQGGDNIAGVIALSSVKADFNESQDLRFSYANIGTLYKSNDKAKSLNLKLGLASENMYLQYAGVHDEAQSYVDGNGDKVLDTLYRSSSHIVSAGYRDEAQQANMTLSHQNVPYQGFPNQYMDMTDNKSTGIAVQYQRLVSQWQLDAHVSWRDVKHEMGFFTAEKMGVMPMLTESQDIALKLHWQTDLASDETITLGQEYYKNSLDDWWPAVPGMGMMGPNDYRNITDGERQRAAVFAEWEQTRADAWQYILGARIEQVSTDAGDVQAYNAMPMMGMPNVDHAAAVLFNQQDRSQQDVLLDATFIASKELQQGHTVVLGLARKNRAPNLYERYTWGRGAMATSMIGWFGDANGYVGSIDLQPETAHTANISYQYDSEQWAISADLWYTQVNDYIDAQVIGNIVRGGDPISSRNILQFVNLDASLKGLTFKVSNELAKLASGKWYFHNVLRWQQGERDDSNEDLYQILPLQNRMQLSHQSGNWQNTLEWEWIGSKDDVDNRRLENTTDSYSLLNISSQYEWRNVSIELALTNALDTYYEAPIGGVSVAQYRQTPEAGFEQLAGRGRSIDFGLSYKF